ncbi:hypothetical protein ZTR_01539 [Talaromyces verruculosus]|nr:hypothetical protein ZTR_01539 [Talaromyces verruculosus]
MVSAKALLALYAISGFVHAYPIHQHIEDSSGSHLTTRAPSPRFRNPFDVDSYLGNLDYKIPNNKDIQQWVKEARKKGALAASGKFSGNDDKDDKEEDHDDDHDDDDDEDQHSNKATPKESGEDDDDKDEDNHHHDQHTTQSATRPEDEHHEVDDEKYHENLNGNGVTQPIQSGQSSSSTSTHGSSIPTATLTTAVAPIPSPNQEGDEGNNIEIMQPLQSVQPSQPTNAQASSAPTTTPSSTAPSIDAPNQQPNDEHDDEEDNEDETNQVMQPNNAQDSATPTTPSNTINDGDHAAAPPAVQTVYVPVNVFPTRFPDFPDIDDEKPSPSSTPLPIFSPPEDITKADLPPAAVLTSTEGNTDIHGPEVSDAPVAEDAPTTPDFTTNPDVADAPTEEQPSDNVHSTASTYTPRPQMPSHEAQLSKVSELLDMFTPKDESEPSY